MISSTISSLKTTSTKRVFRYNRNNDHTITEHNKKKYSNLLLKKYQKTKFCCTHTRKIRKEAPHPMKLDTNSIRHSIQFHCRHPFPHHPPDFFLNLINWRLDILPYRRSPHRRSYAANIPEIIVVTPITERLIASDDARPDASVDEEEHNQQDNQYGEEHRTDFIAVAPAIDAVEYFAVDGTDSFRIERIVCVLIVIGGVLLTGHRCQYNRDHNNVTC